MTTTSLLATVHLVPANSYDQRSACLIANDGTEEGFLIAKNMTDDYARELARRWNAHARLVEIVELIDDTCGDQLYTMARAALAAAKAEGGGK